MKLRFLLALCAASFLSTLADGSRFSPNAISPRRIIIGNKAEITICKDGNAEFEVVAPANPAAAPAARELIEMLGQITGKNVKTVEKASGNVPAFFLGECPEAEAIGLNPSKLDRDGFYIKTDANRIFITGCDSKDSRKVQNATLFGVYDFLERFAGVRYYFPGDVGTIVPKKRDWTLPSIDITERPDTQYRWIYCYPCARLSGNIRYEYPGMKQNNPPIWRNSTLKSIRSCHGLNDLELVKRFAKTNPEFFAMTATGDRHDGSKITTSYHKLGHLCFSSKGLKEVIYQDVVACLTGKPASSRGISAWSSRWNTTHVDLAPNDGMLWCLCPECKKIQAQGKQAMSDHIWRFACDIANRLKKDGIDGYVMMDCYGQFNMIPSFPIPDNVMLGVAVTGPWGMSNETVRNRDAKRLHDWSTLAKAKIKTWTYPTKASAAVPVVPNFTPRAVAEFYKSQKDNIFGSFFEAGSDRWMYGFLNCYVFSKVMWNFETDVEALIDEHCRLMYSNAAPQMMKFYAELENIWMNSIVKEVVSTPWGEEWKIPTRRDIWTRILSPDKLKEIGELLGQAKIAVANDADSRKRLSFMLDELWQPILDGSAAFLREASDRTVWTLKASDAQSITLDGVLDESAWKVAEPVWLNSSKPSQKVEVHTRVKMLQDKDFLYFGFEADEPETERMLTIGNRKPDSSEVWRDNGVEIFLSADLSSDFIYQFIFNSAGFKADMKNSLVAVDSSFDSGFEVKTNVTPDKMWTAECIIPRKSLPELSGKQRIVGNFTRHRVLDGLSVGTEFYVWFRKSRNIAENCGFIQLDSQNATQNIVKTGDFDKPILRSRHIGAGDWSVVDGSKFILQDNEIFVTKGVSLRLESDCSNVRQSVPFKPDTMYKLSFMVRTEELTPGLRVIVRYGGDPAPARYILGDYRDYIRDTTPWHRIESQFRTPKQFGTQYSPFIQFSIGNSTGKAWLDHVELIEMK